MEKTYIMQTAETIRLQLFATTPANTLLSWGIEKFIGTVSGGMAALAFKVNGRLFDGNVVVAYSEGDDLYEVYLLNCAGARGSVAGEKKAHLSAYFTKYRSKYFLTVLCSSAVLSASLSRLCPELG